VEAEYIIMEEAPGTQLEDVWDSKTISDKTNIVKGLVEIEKKLLSVSFTRFVFRGGTWYQRMALILD
jgi:hypothetical protein